MKVLSRSLVTISRSAISSAGTVEGTVVHRVASRKTSLSATRSGPNSSTGPRVIACWRTCCATPSSSTSKSAVPPATSRTRMPRTSRSQPASPSTDQLVGQGRPGGQFGNGACGNDFAAGQDDEVVAEPLDQVELVAGEQHRNLRRDLLAEQVHHRVDRERVETAERLVQDQRDRLVHQRRGDLHPLLVAERQRLQYVGRPLAEPESLEQLVGALGRPDRVEPVQPAEEHQLVADLHLRVQPALLGHVTEVTPDRLGQRPAVPPHLAGGRGQHAEDDPHRRRLAGAVGPDEPGHPSRYDVETHVVQRQLFPEPPGQPSHAQHPSPFPFTSAPSVQARA